MSIAQLTKEDGCTVETAKVLNGFLSLYRDHKFLESVKLTDAMRLQLIAELTDELRYPQ